jgi:hypothetical protein
LLSLLGLRKHLVGFSWASTEDLESQAFEQRDKEEEQLFPQDGHAVLGARPDVLALSFDETQLAVTVGNRVVVYAVKALVEQKNGAISVHGYSVGSIGSK